MNGRELTVLTALAGVLTVGEFGSAVQIGLGRDPGGAVFAETPAARCSDPGCLGARQAGRGSQPSA